MATAEPKGGNWLGSKGPSAPLPDAQDNVKRADNEHLSEDGVYGPTCLVGKANEGSVEYVAVIPEDGVYDIYTYHHTSVFLLHYAYQPSVYEEP